MASRFPPQRESLLVPWSANYKEKIQLSPTTYSLTAAQATAYGTLHDDFVTKWNTCQDPTTKTRSAVEIKNAAKDLLVRKIRELSKIVNNSPTTTNALRIDLGLPERDFEPTPVPMLLDAPVLTILSIYGHNIRIRVRDASGAVRGRPENADGAVIYSFAGATAPVGTDGWKSEGPITRDSIIVAFDESIAVGAKVWLTAQWFNTRSVSPGCTPVAAVIGAEGALAA